MSLVFGTFGGAFVPTSITGLVLWVKADSLALSDGDPVSTWTDSSTQGNNLTQATGANQPTYKTAIVNGKPVVRFNGTSTFLSHADNASLSPAAISVFIVAKTNAAPLSGNRILLEKELSFRFITSETSTANIAVRLGTSGTAWGSGGFTGTTALTTSFSLWEMTYNAVSDLEFYVNGTTAGSGAPSGDIFDNTSTLYLGCYNATDFFWDGDVAEVLIYNSALSTTNRQSVENYLTTKYSL